MTSTLTVGEALALLGLEPRGGGYSCLGCGADRRGSQDPRGPVGVRRDGAGWRCHACGLTGDGLTLAALASSGEPRPTSWRPVFAWLEARGVDRTSRPAPPPPPVRVPMRPPAEELHDLWARSRPVVEDHEVATWLAGRGLDPSTVADLDVARALPADAACPSWAGCGAVPWARSGHRLLMPLVDAAGEMRSLRARAIVADAKRKSLAPARHEVAGLVMACPLARLVLAGKADGLGRPAAGVVRELGLVVVEGLPDFLAWSTGYGAGGGLERAPAVVGVESGAWTGDVVARVPDGARVFLRTHVDEAGDRYAEAVARSLAHRCDVLRLTRDDA